MRQKLTMCVVEFLAHFHVRVRECARTGTFLLLAIVPDNLQRGLVALAVSWPLCLTIHIEVSLRLSLVGHCA